MGMGFLALTPGALFAGDFEVQRELARGGMGAVYVVRQRSTGRVRALKTMLPAAFADEGLRQRFVREATVASRIESEPAFIGALAGLAAAVDELGRHLETQAERGEGLANCLRRTAELALGLKRWKNGGAPEEGEEL
jgi:serine/threonine protein kinase